MTNFIVEILTLELPDAVAFFQRPGGVTYDNISTTCHKRSGGAPFGISQTILFYFKGFFTEQSSVATK